MDFPPISKEDNPEVLAEYIATHAKETGETIQDEDIPDTSDGAPLRVKGKRTKVDTESEVVVGKAKKQKVAKSEATNYDSASAPTPKRKRVKGDTSITNEEMQLALEEEQGSRPRKRQPTTKIVSPMFIVTPAMASRAKERDNKLIADKKKQAAQYLMERDEKLMAIGPENCDEYYVEKIAEVKGIAGEVAQDAVKEAWKVLEKNQGTTEAGALGSVPESVAPESTSEADRLESPLSSNPSDHNSTKVTHISVSPIISPSSSPLTDSNQDNISLSQRINMLPKLIHKTKPSIRVNPTLVGTKLAEVVMGSTIQKQTDICQKSSQPTRLKPLQEAQPSAAAEDSEDPEEPSTSNLPNFGSPSNLFSLEKHLGGELIKTP